MTKILIVDDNDEDRYMLRVLLEGYGYEVAEAINGAEALEAARRDPPDMIIADILMPIMDGFSLCRHWRRDIQLKGSPFIFYSATYTDARDQEFGLSLGADRYIIKPVEPDVFVRILLEVIREHEASRLVVHDKTVEEEPVYLREYNAVLIRKLEDKLAELEETNQALEQDVARRKQVEEQLNSSLREKEVLLKEVHHRVKNNLQVLSSLLTLQADSIKNEEGLKALTESRSRVMSMALVHEQLYNSKNLARIDFAAYVHNLASQLLRSYGIKPGQIDLQLAIDPISLGVDQAIPCGLIITELISNALTYAFPAPYRAVETPPEIRVSLRSEQAGALTLTVSDTGVGLPPTVDLDKPGGLGLQLVTTLTRQLQGVIALEHEAGTTFHITFPYPLFKQGS